MPMTRKKRQMLADLKRKYVNDGRPCHYCGIRLTADNFSWDHVVPKCEGGTLEKWNRVATCKLCNRMKGCMRPQDWDEWRRRLVNWMLENGEVLK